MIKEQNDNGKFFPLWGTCQGYEDLVAFTADMGFSSLGGFEM